MTTEAGERREDAAGGKGYHTELSHNYTGGRGFGVLVHSSVRNDTVNELYISEGREDFESFQHEGGMFEERGLS